MNPIIENPLDWIYLPTALALGALHALEPGHAKTLTAAYLIGIKGTKRDAIILGLSVATTHSIVVVGISLSAMWVGRETFTQDVSHWLQIVSSVIVIIIGIWMLTKRIRQMKQAKMGSHHHHHEPINIESPIARGHLEISATSNGERIKFITSHIFAGSTLQVLIDRPSGSEILELKLNPNQLNCYESAIAPSEPHEFSAVLEITCGETREEIPFNMYEPSEHHDHNNMSDDEHARAHAKTIPEYAKKGERPSLLQIISFGAAGGMIPCPASITVMIFALSIGKFASGILAVAGFSIGLAFALVGIGLIVVAGLSRFQQGTGRFHWVSVNAPILSASMVVISGLVALLFIH